MIQLKNILAENMRRFGTKNLNESNVNAVDEKPMTLLGKRVVVIDGIAMLTAFESIQAAKEYDARLLTKQEIDAYLKTFVDAKYQGKAFVQNPYNPDVPVLWDLEKNAPAVSDGVPASRLLGIKENPDFEQYK